jgi:hypothetical protein
MLSLLQRSRYNAWTNRRVFELCLSVDEVPDLDYVFMVGEAARPPAA